MFKTLMFILYICCGFKLAGFQSIYPSCHTCMGSINKKTGLRMGRLQLHYSGGGLLQFVYLPGKLAIDSRGGKRNEAYIGSLLI